MLGPEGRVLPDRLNDPFPSSRRADTAGVFWRKSSRSTHAGNCVEVGDLSEIAIGVRDSKDNGPGCPMLIFPRREWDRFLSGVLTGDFDLPASIFD